MKVFTTHLNLNLMIKMINIYKKQTHNKDTKPQNVFDYLKSSSQEAKDLIDEIEEANDDIDYNKLLFVGSSSEELKFNTFGTLLSFLLAIFNSKITLKRQNLRKEI